MELRQQSGLHLFSTFFSDVKPPQPENLTHSSHLFKHPSPRHGDYKPNSLFNNPPCHFQNPSRGIIDLNYSDQYHHHRNSSLNPFDGGVHLPVIEKGFNDHIDACYNHYSGESFHLNHQSNYEKVFPYASRLRIRLLTARRLLCMVTAARGIITPIAITCLRCALCSRICAIAVYDCTECYGADSTARQLPRHRT